MRKSINLLGVLALVITFGVLSVSAAVKTTTIRIKGMTCGSCAFSITKALKETNGVDDVRVSFENGEAWIKYDDRKITIAQLRQVINGTGYKAVEETGRKISTRRAKRKTN
jgi:copper chaperone